MLLNVCYVYYETQKLSHVYYLDQLVHINHNFMYSFHIVDRKYTPDKNATSRSLNLALTRVTEILDILPPPMTHQGTSMT
jgi:hypothetical protein